VFRNGLDVINANLDLFPGDSEPILQYDAAGFYDIFSHGSCYRLGPGDENHKAGLGVWFGNCNVL